MKPFSLALFALVIVGCSQEQSHNELLCRSAQIVFTQPDSVVRMLSPHYNDSTMTAADRALYGLLYTEALHRSGLSTASDSLIRTSRDFYERHGDDEHLSRALLHHGIILYRQQQVHEAVLSMKRAELLSGGLDLPAFKWRRERQCWQPRLDASLLQAGIEGCKAMRQQTMDCSDAE